MTARTILPEDDDGHDDVTGSGSCPLAAAGLWILSAQWRAQLWILTAGSGWPLALAWATTCPALDLACGRLLGEVGRASGTATRRRDGVEGGVTGGGVEAGLRNGKEDGTSTRGGEEVGLHDGEEGGATGEDEEVGMT